MLYCEAVFRIVGTGTGLLSKHGRRAGFYTATSVFPGRSVHRQCPCSTVSAVGPVKWAEQLKQANGKACAYSRVRVQQAAISYHTHIYNKGPRRRRRRPTPTHTQCNDTVSRSLAATAGTPSRLALHRFRFELNSQHTPRCRRRCGRIFTYMHVLCLIRTHNTTT